MIFYAMLKPNGCIESAGMSRTPPEGHVVLPEGLTPEYQLWIRYVDGMWEGRPDLPAWVRTATGVRIDDCPDGVVFEVYDAETGAFFGTVESTDGLLTLDLPDPGTYRIHVSAPDPWVAPDPFTVEIEE